eukprot:TRINITY_DN7782_c0_g1_i2.p1 TRINITY_DN7782_c0_g1~~TRINITY_DN7782_c0_g1_i2.p1  ORF type:complete len:281 (-),score=47.33 TRINITY_DN7782_c0_g1_i2:5-847(-)
MAELMEVEVTKSKPDKPKPTKTQLKETSLPWVEKYRPTNLGDLISQEDLIETLSRFIEQNKLPHLLFYGPPGTGKTSTILSVARKILGSSFRSMILELNASDVRGIDDVRETIKDFASTKKIFSQGVKIVVLDEADHMTNDAQAALRRIIERYTKSTRFCLICNHINRITPAIQSRCMRFRFAPLKDDQVRLRLSEIAKQEGVKITADGLEALIKLGTGDMRRSINILQSTSMAYDIVNEMNVYLCTGNPLPNDIRLILDWMCNKAVSYTHLTLPTIYSV